MLLDLLPLFDQDGDGWARAATGVKHLPRLRRRPQKARRVSYGKAAAPVVVGGSTGRLRAYQATSAPLAVGGTVQGIVLHNPPARSAVATAATVTRMAVAAVSTASVATSAVSRGRRLPDPAEDAVLLAFL